MFQLLVRWTSNILVWWPWIGFRSFFAAVLFSTNNLWTYVHSNGLSQNASELHYVKYQQQISRPISIHSSIYAGTIIQFWIFKSCSLGVTGQAIKLCTSRWYLHSRVSLGIMNVCTRQLHWASRVDVAKRDVHRQDNLGGAWVGPSKGQISFPITRHPEGTFSGACFR